MLLRLHLQMMWVLIHYLQHWDRIQMKLIVCDTKIISPEYCKSKDKETTRKEYVCTKKIKVFWIKKCFTSARAGESLSFLWRSVAPQGTCTDFYIKILGRMFFVCYPVNGMRFIEGLLLRWKIFGLLPSNQKKWVENYSCKLLIS